VIINPFFLEILKSVQLRESFKIVVLFVLICIESTGGPRLVRFLGPGKNRTMRNFWVTYKTKVNLRIDEISSEMQLHKVTPSRIRVTLEYLYFEAKLRA
jgi:hypothetical protein